MRASFANAGANAGADPAGALAAACSLADDLGTFALTTPGAGRVAGLRTLGTGLGMGMGMGKADEDAAWLRLVSGAVGSATGVGVVGAAGTGTADAEGVKGARSAGSVWRARRNHASAPSNSNSEPATSHTQGRAPRGGESSAWGIDTGCVCKPGTEPRSRSRSESARLSASRM